MAFGRIETSALERLLARTLTAGLFAVVAAGSWDIWWHGAVGRDTFWEPPHIVLQAAVAVVVLGAVYGWFRLRATRWAWLALAALLAPASAPFDELWHRAFGVESLRSPLIVWSPPHLALVGGLLGALVLALPVLHKDRDPVARSVFISLAAASILTLLLFLAQPLEPLGPYHLAGFAGTAAQALFIALVLYVVKDYLPGAGSALLTTAFFITLGSIAAEPRQVAPGVNIPPHGHPPGWLWVFSYLLPSALVDLVGSRWPRAVTGGAIGLLYAGTLYVFTGPFLEPLFRYSTAHALTAVVSGVIGGAVGGSIFSGHQGHRR